MFFIKKNYNNHFLLFLVFISLYLTSNLKADQPNSYTLDGLLSIAERSNLDLMIEGKEIDIREKESTIINKSKPNLELGLDIGKDWSLNTNEEALAYSISLSRSIINPGKKRYETEKADFSLKIAEYKKENIKNNLFFEIKKHFYTLILLQSEHKFEQEKIKFLQNMLNIVKERGHSTKSELTESRLKIELYKVENEEKQIEGKIGQTELSLNTLLNGELGENYKVTGDFGIPEKEYRISDLIQLAENSNPILLEKLVEIEQAESGLSLEKVGFNPIISPGISYQQETDKKSVNLGVDFSIPSKKVKKDKIRRSETIYEKSKLEVELTQKNIIASLKQQFETYQILKEQEDNFKKRLKESNTLFSLTKLIYQQGDIDLFNLIDSYMTYWQTKEDYCQLLYDITISLAKIEKLIGKKLE